MDFALGDIVSVPDPDGDGRLTAKLVGQLAAVEAREFGGDGWWVQYLEGDRYGITGKVLLRQVTAHPARDFLKGLQGRHRMPSAPEGSISYWRATVEAETDDIESVLAWAEAVGGGEGTTPPYEPRNIPSGRRAEQVPGEAFIHVPRQALYDE